MRSLKDRPALTRLLARRFHAIAEPTRLQILFALQSGERSVTEVAEETGLHQANASKHLQVLYQAGFVKRRREGLFTYYGLADHAVLRLCEVTYRHLRDEYAARGELLLGDSLDPEEIGPGGATGEHIGAAAREPPPAAVPPLEGQRVRIQEISDGNGEGSAL